MSSITFQHKIVVQFVLRFNFFSKILITVNNNNSYCYRNAAGLFYSLCPFQLTNCLSSSLDTLSGHFECEVQFVYVKSS